MEKIGKVFKVIIDKKKQAATWGETEFDSVEVDNEVVIHSTKKLYCWRVLRCKDHQGLSDYDIEGEIVKLAS